MAEIDKAINKLIEELKKIQADSGSPGGGSPRRDIPEPEFGNNREAEEIVQRINDLYDQRLDKENEAIKAQREQVIQARKALQAKLDTLQAGDELNDTNKQQVQTLAEQVAKQEQFLEKLRESESVADSLAETFGSLFSGKKFSDSDLKKMLDPKNIQGFAKKLSTLNSKAAITGFLAKAAYKGLYEYSKAAINLAIDLGNMETQFMKATGASKEFARGVTVQYEEMREFGATMKQVSAANQELYTTFTDFTMISEKQRNSLGKTATALAMVGVSNADFAKSVQISTKAMGMSTDQAAQNMLNLEKFAENLGVAPQQLAADFAGAGDMLAKMGDQGEKAFKDLAIVAKTTGMSMQSLLAITNRFDTFDGAADQAGRLNAALGGNFVNAMDLMMAEEPAERFQMIRDSILDAGLSFEDMSYYQKNFYRDSLGLSDVGELAALLSGDMDLVTGATQESAQSMIDAKRRAHEMATFQDRLNTVFAQMIPIITPLIDALSDMTLFLTENMDIIKPLIGVAIILASVIGLIIPEAASTAGGIAGLTLGLGILFDSVETGEDSLSGLGIVFGEISDAFGELFDALGAAFKPLMDLFGLIDENTQDGAGLSIMIGMIKGFAYALAFPIRVITQFINLFLLLRDGLYALFTMITGVGDGVNAFSATLGRFVGIVGKFFDPIYRVAHAFGLAGDEVRAFGHILFEKDYASNFLEGIVKVANAFSLMATGIAENLNPFNAMTNLIDGIGNAFSGVISAVTSFFTAITDPSAAENVVKIAEAISAIPTRKNIEFASSMGALAATNAAVGAVAAANTTANTITNFIGVGGQNQNTTQIATTTPQEITINVMLDRNKLATVVQEINGEQAKRAIQGTQ